MEYVVRFAQHHESFRVPEIKALAALAGVEIDILFYHEYTPYCIVKLPNEAAARAVIARSILAKDIFELWGFGTNYKEVHADIKQRTPQRWNEYRETSFAFYIDSFAGKRTEEAKRVTIESFSYLGFDGPIRLKDPDVLFYIMEEYVSDFEKSVKKVQQSPEPRRIFVGRWIADGSREVFTKYDLKKRRYISTTSMDAELSLVTANMAHAAPGKIFFDPFVGTGSFQVAAAHFGAMTLGSDIDGRSFRGKNSEHEGLGVLQNFRQYGLLSRFVDVFTSDLTNTPLRNGQFLDGIICDPPYGVREGLRVLGSRDGRGKEPVMIDGVPAHLRPGFIPPKRPYGFEAMQTDILSFAARSLVTGGRLSMWMPTASDEDVEFPVPMHPNLEVVSISVQPFNNWSRRLITYCRLPAGQLSDVTLARCKVDAEGVRASELNAFRRKYLTRNSDPRPAKRDTVTE